MNIVGWMKALIVTGTILVATPVMAEPLRDFNDKPVSMQDYTGQGKWLVVMIWAADCHICNEEAREYSKFHEQYKNTNARVLGISIDGQLKKSAAEDFIKRHNTPFPHIIGEPGDIAQWFYDITGVVWQGGTPTFLIYNPKGELVIQQIGAVPVNLVEEFIQKESNQ